MDYFEKSMVGSVLGAGNNENKLTAEDVGTVSSAVQGLLKRAAGINATLMDMHHRLHGPQPVPSAGMDGPTPAPTVMSDLIALTKALNDIESVALRLHSSI